MWKLPVILIATKNLTGLRSNWMWQHPSQRSCLLGRPSVLCTVLLINYKAIQNKVISISLHNYSVKIPRFYDKLCSDCANYCLTHYVICHCFHQRNPKHCEATPPLEPFRSYASIHNSQWRPQKRPGRSQIGRVSGGSPAKLAFRRLILVVLWLLLGSMGIILSCTPQRWL